MDIIVAADAPLVESLKTSSADGVIFGVAPFAQRFRENYKPSRLRELLKDVSGAGFDVWLAMNAIIHEEELPQVKQTLEALRGVSASGLLFADLAIIRLAKAVGLELPLIYHPETYVTSAADVRALAAAGVDVHVLARESTLEGIERIAEETDAKLAFVGHGHLNMFHSRRHQLSLFAEQQQQSPPARGIVHYIREHSREGRCPIYEDARGTHIFRPHPSAAFQAVESFKNHLDFLIVDSLLLEDAAVLTAVEDYARARSGQTIKGDYRQYDSGFLFEQTGLKPGGRS